MENNEIKTTSNFIKEIINKDNETKKHDGRVHTRFPPEPNGYIHIGHAKSICLNFGLAIEYNGKCNLRFDDTNPVKEDTEYVDSIKNDVKWLGFDWEDREFFASDYFEQLYNFAIELIKKNKAYVCSLNADEIREYRGTLKAPGKESPYRNRSVAENLELFEKMKNGEFKEGEHVLRAKIDMASGNIVMRDPVIYRILFAHHHRTKSEWCIYPMYDFTHCLSDSIEGITHSICTLEFENNRPLYDWTLNELDVPHKPQQIEFARLNLTYTVMSKRYLLELVKGGYVNGWDDPRMPTVCGLRRRGYSSASIRDFANRIGVAKADSIVDYALLEHCLREDLNKKANRVIAVQKPLKLIITNYPEGEVEELEAINNPEDESKGKRLVPFSRELYIEQDDFMEDAPKKFFRLAPGKEVRLKYAYYVKCTDVIKDQATGEIKEVHCTYDQATRGGWSEDGRKGKGTIHWLSASHAIPAEIRLFDHLFTKENPNDLPEGEDFKTLLNKDSLQVIDGAYVEPSLAEAKIHEPCQFERLGYYCLDDDATAEKLIFNRTVSLRDTWAKIQNSMKK